MFKGLGNLGNLANLMKEAGQIKDKVEALRAELATRTVEGAAGGGMVVVKASGSQEIISVEIDPEILEGNDRELLQDLVAAATNVALANSREMMREELAKITGGLGIDLPGIV